MKTIDGKLIADKELINLKGGVVVNQYQCRIEQDGSFWKNETLPGENCTDAGTNYEYYLGYWYPGHTWSVECCSC